MEGGNPCTKAVFYDIVEWGSFFISKTSLKKYIKKEMVTD